MDVNSAQESAELKARLKAFAAILRLCKDSLEQPDLASTAVHIVNNPKGLLGYERSTLLDLRTGKAAAEFSQTEPSQHSEYVRLLLTLAKGAPHAKGSFEVYSGSESMKELKGGAADAAAKLTESGEHLILVPLRSATHDVSRTEPFIWCLEYSGAAPGHVNAALPLLTSQFGAALWSHLGRGFGGRFFSFLCKITLGRFFLLLLAAFAVCLFTVELDHTVSAEFVVKPRSVYSSYAWFDCVVKRCCFNDGDKLKAGDTVLEYDVSRMKFQLAAAEGAFNEARAELEQETKASFTEKERLGRLKMLECKRDQARVAIDEAKWYLAHSVVKAPTGGVLALPEGSADKVSGRAIRVGEKQFDIFSDDGMTAEIHVNEKDASVLEDNPRIALFLHTRPELPIPLKVLSTSYYPELTEQNIYSYNIRGEMKNDIPGLRYGMRGVARVTGKRVKLGYYLFRSLVLWYRGI